MLRLQVLKSRTSYLPQKRLKSSSSFIRNTFINYFKDNHGHKHIKSSSVVPLCDPTVPFVNAGMNQFKGVFLGVVDAPCPRAVNSQKCIRVGGKHNDLELVGMDGHHHTFFEMLGNWSFGDYYKKEACEMAWNLLLGPYKLNPENLLVTYFEGDPIIGLPEDRECRDIWKDIGVQPSHIKAHGARDNFWEMGLTGPCGPCTEIHYIHPDGSLTEIWNIVFIQCNREADGSVSALRRQHVDTGMGLERMTALLQGVPSNYDTDLFRPLINVIEKNSKGVSPYTASYKNDATVDRAYRRLADHARMISVCLADGVFPSSSLNLKQIMRKSFKISSEVFQNPNLLSLLYNEMMTTLGGTYPELVAREKEAKLIIDHENDSYIKLRADLAKKWKDLVRMYPEVEELNDIDLAGFALGYTVFKKSMSKINSSIIPGELVFKLYDTHGFQEDVIERIAKVNNLGIDKKGFWKLLSNHKSRHKTAFKEQTTKTGIMFDKAIEKLNKNGIKKTNDQPKYDYTDLGDEVLFKPLKSKLLALLNEDGEWLDFSEPCEDKPYYIVTENSNFYCEEGGQIAEDGVIHFNRNLNFKVDSVFKIRDIIFHKGYFVDTDGDSYVKLGNSVVLEINSEKRLNVMLNHTGVHLLNAAIREVLPNSVICQTGSSVTDKYFTLNLSVYGEKLSYNVVIEAQDLIKDAIESNATVQTKVIDSTQLSSEPGVLTVPGETYPEVGIRLVTISPPLVSKELCCGTHAARIAAVRALCVMRVRGARSHAPALLALTGRRALQARELFCRAQKLAEVIELADPDRVKDEATSIRKELSELCGEGGAPYGEYATCLQLLANLEKKATNKNDLALQSIAQSEIMDACQDAVREGRRFTVHFLRCSYLMQSEAVRDTLGAGDQTLPTMLLGCAGGVVVATARVPQEMVTPTFTAEKWLSCVLPIFKATILPATSDRSLLTHAEMSATKVSLINCEQLVQDSMRVAIKYAQSHVKDTDDKEHSTQNRQHN
ncbi:alanine--tRNA ligase, mitochondrial [Melitaea cinxia]|uniref:alanine--tRNA ligase, mitochondrial n=1 Tax=Melitaea cinxia TaxID=113334 RepID=UPI001E270877|nr:alanine--tRNA ligase, mitochondrial [Melitaea cinxia]